MPDRIWAASTSGSSTNPIPYLNNGWWVSDQRTRQYLDNCYGPYFIPSLKVAIDLDNRDADTVYWANVGQYCQPVCSKPGDSGLDKSNRRHQSVKIKPAYQERQSFKVAALIEVTSGCCEAASDSKQMIVPLGF